MSVRIPTWISKAAPAPARAATGCRRARGPTIQEEGAVDAIPELDAIGVDHDALLHSDGLT